MIDVRRGSRSTFCGKRFPDDHLQIFWRQKKDFDDVGWVDDALRDHADAQVRTTNLPLRNMDPYNTPAKEAYLRPGLMESIRRSERSGSGGKSIACSTGAGLGPRPSEGG